MTGLIASLLNTFHQHVKEFMEFHSKMIPGRLIYEIIKEMILSTVYEIGPLCLLFSLTNGR